MYYMKDEQGNFLVLNGEFYYQCAECGKMEEIDLLDMAREDPHFDLFSTNIYCARCTRERRREGAEADRK